MSAPTADHLEDLRSVDPDAIVDLGNVRRDVYLRAVGKPTQVALRNELGGVVLGAETVRTTKATAKFLLEQGRALLCTRDGRPAPGRRPTWARSIPCRSFVDPTNVHGVDWTASAARTEPIEFALSDDLPEQQIIVRMVKGAVRDLEGVEYGPGSVVQGPRTDLAPIVARGHGVAIPPPTD